MYFPGVAPDPHLPLTKNALSRLSGKLRLDVRNEIFTAVLQSRTAMRRLVSLVYHPFLTGLPLLNAAKPQWIFLGVACKLEGPLFSVFSITSLLVRSHARNGLPRRSARPHVLVSNLPSSSLSAAASEPPQSSIALVAQQAKADQTLPLVRCNGCLPLLQLNCFAPSGVVDVHGSQTHHSARFHPFQSQSRRPNLAHRAPVPALFHPQCPHPTPVGSLGAHAGIPFLLHRPVPSLSRKSSNAMCLLPHNSRSWNNPDTFGADSGAVALAPDAGYMFGVPPPVAASSVVPGSGYEFRERKPSAALSDLDTEYTFTMEGAVCRRSRDASKWRG
jgi:hypothetical protein